MYIDTSKLPIETKTIFDILRNGNFIVDNHPNTASKRLFDICENHFETFTSYFEPLGYTLERGSGYYLFYTDGILETAKEHRITQILFLLDLIDLMLGAFPNFGVGWRGSPSDLEMALKNDTLRRERLEKMRGIKGKTLLERCNSVFNSFDKFGCMEAMEDKYSNYLMLSSYNYVVDFFDAVKRINSEIDNFDEDEL